jgi:hypothetical protein
MLSSADCPIDADRNFLGDMAEDRREVEERISGWTHQVSVSVGRALSHMFEDGRSSTPSQAISRWLSANCRGGWVQVCVPGRGNIVAMNDQTCAERFRLAFGSSQKPPSYSYAD